jgi:hypothetical protein
MSTGIRTAQHRMADATDEQVEHRPSAVGLHRQLDAEVLGLARIVSAVGRGSRSSIISCPPRATARVLLQLAVLSRCSRHLVAHRRGSRVMP